MVALTPNVPSGDRREVEEPRGLSTDQPSKAAILQLRPELSCLAKGLILHSKPAWEAAKRTIFFYVKRTY